MKSFAILLVAGKSTRFENNVSKQVFLLKGKPVFSYPLDALLNNSSLDEIIVVTNEEHKSEIERYIGNNPKVKVCLGGETRQISVEHGLAMLNADANDIVLIHDGVRPFIDNDLLEKCLNTTLRYGNAITVSPAVETISVLDSDNNISSIMPRQKCVLARAPQVFYLDSIYAAHLLAKKEGKLFVDSASMLFDQKVALNTVEGPLDNIKITTPYDLKVCELLMEQKYEKR